MKEYPDHLKQIRYFEAKEADWGAKAAIARKEYAKMISEFEPGQWVNVLDAWNNKTQAGIVSSVVYKTDIGLYIWVVLYTKDHKKPKLRRNNTKATIRANIHEVGARYTLSPIFPK